jgi:cytoskeletal protein CcmA (bactofilin family)
MAGDNQIVDKPIVGDLMIAGGQIRVTSNVSGDVYVTGGQIDIAGTIGGNLIVAGGNVTISGKVVKNLIAAGGQIKVDNLSSIGGYTLAAGGEVGLMGKFAGPVKVGGGNLVVGEKAQIGGNLEADVSKSDVSTSAKIVGSKKINIYETKTYKPQVNQDRNYKIVKEVISFASSLLILLVFVKIFYKKISQKGLLSGSFWSTSGWGLIVLIVTPFVMLFLTITIIGIPLSIIIFVLYFIALYLSHIVASIAAGQMMTNNKYVKTNNPYLQGLLGLVLLTMLGVVPFVGGFVKFIAVLVGLGILYRQMLIES